VSGTVFDALSGCAVRSMWFLCGEAQGGVVPSLLHWPSACTVDRGPIETVSYRNGIRAFSDFGIETVRAPPQTATETTVT
jgi:hypothetical protein